ncbi:MAG TPA: hypothetical protein VG318_02775 [Actinomycetota bacterium]|nr:hypothetical protein [Actinomycetota bacterium]
MDDSERPEARLTDSASEPNETGLTVPPVVDDASNGGPPQKTSKATRSKKKKKTARQSGSRSRKVRTFPASTFEEALVLAQAIDRIAAGQPIRRLTLFHKLGKSPDSGPTRQLITNSGKYGLTKGSYKAEHLELTPDGRVAVSADVAPREQLQARFRLAVESVPPFKVLYDRFMGNKLPAQVVLRDFLVDQGYSAEEVQECVDTFIVNAKFLGLLQTVAGAERLLAIGHALEEVSPATTSGPATTSNGAVLPTAPRTGGATDWSKICFYVTPIGDPDSEERQHSDLFLSSLVEPALSEFELSVVRADQIGKPGMITTQILEYVVKARLVVADLSFHNPNVFYELSLRHVSRLPTVQLIRAADRIPFDLDQFRTIRIDTTSIFTLVPKLDVYRAEIANQARQVLNDPDAVDNPLTTFYPSLAAARFDGNGGASSNGAEGEVPQGV